MAFYLVDCTEEARCDFRGEVWQDMSERRPGVPYPSCPQCGGITQRIFTPPTVHGADTARAPGAEYSHALSEGAGPVYVKDRRTWKDMLQRQGLKPAEDGETEAARKSHMRAVKRQQSEAVDACMDQALTVAMSAGAQGLKREMERVAPRAPEDTPCLSKVA